MNVTRGATAGWRLIWRCKTVSSLPLHATGNDWSITRDFCVQEGIQLIKALKHLAKEAEKLNGLRELMSNRKAGTLAWWCGWVVAPIRRNPCYVQYITRDASTLVHIKIQNSIPASVGIRRSCCLSDVGILTASTSSSFTIALPDWLPLLHRYRRWMVVRKFFKLSDMVTGLGWVSNYYIAHLFCDLISSHFSWKMYQRGMWYRVTHHILRFSSCSELWQAHHL